MGASAAIFDAAVGAHAAGGDLATSIASVAGELAAVTVAVRSRRGAPGGAGIVWAAGTIVTNAHVARGAHAEVELADGHTLAARVVRRDDVRDLAELRVDARDVPAATAGDSDALRPGQLVLAMGHPLGVSGALAVGVVHSVAGRPTRLPGDRRRWVQADIRLAPGNSGGPLADALGRVVGVNSMIAAGLGLAVPSASVERFLGGRAERPRLGVTTSPALVRGAAAGDRLGLVVIAVVPGGSAADAGLQLGDVLLGADGSPFVHPAELTTLVAEARVGERVTVDVVRAGRVHQREITLRAGPGHPGRGARAA